MQFDPPANVAGVSGFWLSVTRAVSRISLRSSDLGLSRWSLASMPIRISFCSAVHLLVAFIRYFIIVLSGSGFGVDGDGPG